MDRCRHRSCQRKRNLARESVISPEEAWSRQRKRELAGSQELSGSRQGNPGNGKLGPLLSLLASRRHGVLCEACGSRHLSSKLQTSSVRHRSPHLPRSEAQWSGTWLQRPGQVGEWSSGPKAVRECDVLNLKACEHLWLQFPDKFLTTFSKFE